MMETAERRKQAWFDIGNLAEDMQADFEEAQSLARMTKKTIKLKLEITVEVPQGYEDDGDFISLSYATAVARPPRKSRTFIGSVERGSLVQIGESAAAALQEQLKLEGEVRPSWKPTLKDRAAGEV